MLENCEYFLSHGLLSFRQAFCYFLVELSHDSRAIVFKWGPTYEALRRIGEGPASPYDDVCFEYLNPNTGGPVLPTMACHIQMIRPGVRTQAHRQVNSSVYHVFEGKGYSVINDQQVNWERSDFFTVPPLGLA
ncbi:MAG: hypothetical protein QF619_03535 [Candidatus Binatia bacterium]|nr:hypothetical protein [Candidatus Binatia bacterium]